MRIGLYFSRLKILGIVILLLVLSVVQPASTHPDDPSSPILDSHHDGDFTIRGRVGIDDSGPVTIDVREPEAHLEILVPAPSVIGFSALGGAVLSHNPPANAIQVLRRNSGPQAPGSSSIESVFSVGANGNVIAGGINTGQNVIIGDIAMPNANGRPLTIKGRGLNSEWISFIDSQGNSKWHINHKGEAPTRGNGLNFGETDVADGRLFLAPGGNVGIGTLSPISELHVKAENGNLDLVLESGTGKQWNIVSGASEQFSISEVSAGNAWFTINPGGSVRIGHDEILSGTLHSDFRLSVAGKIVARSIIVTLQNWSDFVFDADYNLISLEEVERFIEINKHLPDIPSSIQVESEGVDVGDMQTRLLQKIEELTLYLIEMNKEIEVLRARIDEIEGS